MATYRQYVQIAARRSAGEVRRGYAGYEELQRNLKATREHEQEAHAKHAALENALSELEVRELEVRERIRTLERGPEMQSAQALDEARERVQFCSEQAERAEKQSQAARKRRSDLEQRRNQTQALCERARTDLDKALELTRQAADEADIFGDHEKAIARIGFPDKVDPVLIANEEAGLNRAIAQKRQAIELIARRRREAEAAEQRHTQVKDRLNEISAQLDEAEEVYADAVRNHDETTERLCAAFRQWRETLTVLALGPDDDLEDALRTWCASGQGGFPLQAEVGAALQDAVSRLARQLERSEQQLEDERQTLRTLQAERERVVSGEHEPPPLDPTRDEASRSDRPGAPLWRLCDFRETIPKARRAGLEAALEASGLLTAWIAPNGQIEGGVHDAFLAAIDRAHDGPNLSEVLKPESAAGTDVPAKIVEAILARIGCGRDQGSAWVDSDGAWRLGPLRGQWRKPDAQHIGPEARLFYREQRLTLLSQKILEHEARIAELHATLSVLATQRETAKREAETLPDPTETTRSLARVDAARARIADVLKRKEQVGTGRGPTPSGMGGDRRDTRQGRPRCRAVRLDRPLGCALGSA